MPRRRCSLDARRRLIAATVAMCFAAAPPASAGDIREFSVGLSVAELPREGYVGFACGNNGARPDKAITGWQDFAGCPADPAGLHEVAFEYDDTNVVSEDYEGTAIAGHAVLISLLFSDSGVVEAIRVFTDPFARPYEKRRARALSYKVKNRFGSFGWACENAEPGPDESEVGGFFTKERCRKDRGDRTVEVYTQFYRTYAGGGEEIVNATSFEIRRDHNTP